MLLDSFVGGVLSHSSCWIVRVSKKPPALCLSQQSRLERAVKDMDMVGDLLMAANHKHRDHPLEEKEFRRMATEKGLSAGAFWLEWLSTTTFDAALDRRQA